MNSNSPKMLIAIVGIFMIVAMGTWLNSVYFCGPKANRVSEQLEYLRDSLAVREVELRQSHPGHELNLIRDMVSITSPKELREIQKILMDSKRKTINHPVSTWSVDLKIKFANNEDLVMAVSRISNDSIETMTYFSFPNNSCPGGKVYYSLELGNYLEEITSYQGTPYK